MLFQRPDAKQRGVLQRAVLRAKPQARFWRATRNRRARVAETGEAGIATYTRSEGRDRPASVQSIPDAILYLDIGMKRFELLTPSSQTICATKLRYIPKIIIIYNTGTGFACWFASQQANQLAGSALGIYRAPDKIRWLYRLRRFLPPELSRTGELRSKVAKQTRSQVYPIARAIPVEYNRLRRFQVLSTRRCKSAKPVSPTRGAN